MCALPHTAPLMLALLASTPAIAQPASDEWDTAGERHLELTADNTGQASEMRISPNQASTLMFNMPLQHGGVLVEEKESFRSVMVDEVAGVVTLIPSDSVPRERPLSVAVRFADDALPRSAIFRLVVHPSRAERQVRVYRRPRSGESYQQEARQEHERAEQCVAELERTRAEQKRPDGLTGLLDAGLVKRGRGVHARDISELTQRPGETLQVFSAFSYRAERRVAVAVHVQNTGPQSWAVEWAELVDPKGSRPRVLRVWPFEPIAPGKTLQLVVEAEATEEQARGTFILKLWEANGPRTITLRGVAFP
ncbi:DUF2381 family protein [Archangium violaceum]|uniref:DUF2381 family protein n=1 Tax=Archangium violaceum TaxID=83451 RepID=UPI00193BA9E6|nr:DUF2381 family protein [Archangium violaceum]QRK09398.1 DUF2381 family protein [Archangium violaceum]